MKGYFTASLVTTVTVCCSSVSPAKNVHTSAAYFDPIGIIDLWKENH